MFVRGCLVGYCYSGWHQHPGPTTQRLWHHKGHWRQTCRYRITFRTGMGPINRLAACRQRNTDRLAIFANFDRLAKGHFGPRHGTRGRTDQYNQAQKPCKKGFQLPHTALHINAPLQAKAVNLPRPGTMPRKRKAPHRFRAGRVSVYTETIRRQRQPWPLLS